LHSHPEVSEVNAGESSDLGVLYKGISAESRIISASPTVALKTIFHIAYKHTMKLILALTFLATLALSLAFPQVGHGSVNGPSGVSISKTDFKLITHDLYNFSAFL